MKDGKFRDSKGDWVFEHSSGYAGYRCQKCFSWIYGDQPARCDCDGLDGYKPVKKNGGLSLSPNQIVEWLQSWWSEDAWREVQLNEYGPDVSHLLRGVADMIEMDGKNNVEWLADLASSFDPQTVKVARHVLDNPKFAEWSASSKSNQHHYGRGGLARHTTEVVGLCLAMASMTKNPVDKRVLFLAALFHDYGKIWDYSILWEGTLHKRLIHHISRSAVEWGKASADKLPQDVQDKVLHAILSHHMSRPAGSPVAPKTREAWLLTLCDNISARMDDADTWDSIGGENQP
jgi:hypothetical protein